ncbi:hypothetical protein MRX96_002468 [Rhipicephalus microplus]
MYQTPPPRPSKTDAATLAATTGDNRVIYVAPDAAANRSACHRTHQRTPIATRGPPFIIAVIAAPSSPSSPTEAGPGEDGVGSSLLARGFGRPSSVDDDDRQRNLSRRQPSAKPLGQFAC